MQQDFQRKIQLDEALVPSQREVIVLSELWIPDKQPIHAKLSQEKMHRGQKIFL